MPNMKNAKKKVTQIAKTTVNNTPYKSKVRSSIRNTEKAINSGDKELAKESLAKTIKSLDNAKVKGLVHENKVSREKSRLTKKINTMK